jgi:hypothetical protein
VALATNLIARQVHFYPATIEDGPEAEKNRTEFGALVALGILERVATPTHRVCPTCNGEMLEVQVVSNTRAYTLCAVDDAAGRDYFNPEELKQWALSTPRLLSLFQRALGIAEPQVNESIQGLLWDLGTQAISGVHYHLFFCRNIDEIEKPHLSIIAALPHSVVFYSGTPHIALPEKVLLVPLADLIKSIGKSITLEKPLVEQYFPKGVYATRDGDLELDDTVVLQGEYLLFNPLRGGMYQKRSEKIRPLGQRIISHLYGIRKYVQHAKTLDELAAALFSSKVSISNEIKRVEKICSDNGLTPVLHKFAGDKWGLNPHLKCCK